MRTRNIDRSAPELALAWDLLCKITGATSFDEAHHTSGEVWQYMGSVVNAGRWVHQFRHRDHPRTGRREYVNVPASWAWSYEADEADARADAAARRASERAARNWNEDDARTDAEPATL